MKKGAIPKSAAAGEKRERLVALHDSLRETLRDFSDLSEKKLWGGWTYRYHEQIFFTLHLRPRTVLVEMKLPAEEAELAMGLGFVHPHRFKRLARNGWVAISVTPEIPFDRMRELMDRSYWSRMESSPRRRWGS